MRKRIFGQWNVTRMCVGPRPHESILRSLSNLANVYESLGDIQDALKTHTEVLTNRQLLLRNAERSGCMRCSRVAAKKKATCTFMKERVALSHKNVARILSKCKRHKEA